MIAAASPTLNEEPALETAPGSSDDRRVASPAPRLHDEPPLRYEPTPFSIDALPARSRRKWLVAGALLALVALFTAWHSGAKYRFIAKRWGVVVPGAVYRSGQISKWVFDRQIAEFGITALIDLNGIEKNDEHQEYEIRRSPELGLKHYRYALGGDGQGDIRCYADAIALIAECRRRGEPVLVHCSAGAQRTGGAIAFYRVLVEGWTPDDAVREMQKYGWRPDRDAELVPYLNANVDALARLLVERGVIDRVPQSPPRFEPK